jgi:hypothetical protein
VSSPEVVADNTTLPWAEIGKHTVDEGASIRRCVSHLNEGRLHNFSGITVAK